MDNNEYKFTLKALQVAFETGFKSGFLEASGGNSPEMGKVVRFEEHIRDVFGIELQKPLSTISEETVPDILGMCITEPLEHSPWIPGVNC